ncbi:hypothetical protein Cni_G20197 [Canna indica]|uniref:Uncharacterized protein n=1 Tax=Canna indica TaxID=4628 RepID=A0AAQ3KNM2_9LILI|nr:hypothetical protein Cni_G20197 [Canna indica]
MEIDKSEDEKLKRVNDALHRLLEKRKQKGKEDKEEDEDLLLSKLLLQLESLEKDAMTNMEPRVPVTKDVSQECGRKQVDMDEIAKELRRVRRQNLITHCLLSVVIVLTAVWQFSEVSLLLATKEKLCHPLRAIGEAVKGNLKGNGKRPRIETSPLPPIGVPELPHVDLPVLTLETPQK